MREIKFRAWDKHTKKMWAWEDHNAFSTGRGSIKEWFDDSDLCVMQYIGLKDKNGIEIYEGDIIEWHDDFDEEPEFIACNICDNGLINIVEFIEDSAEWGITDINYRDDVVGAFSHLGHSCDYSGQHCVVLGNIYQNPGILAYEN